MNSQIRRQAIDPSLVLLVVSAFLIPIFGGYVSTDTNALQTGFAEALREAFGGTDAPVLSHALISLPLLIAVLLIASRNKVLQVPKQLFSLVWLLFFLFLGFSMFFSAFKAVSMLLWGEWLCYGCAMFAGVSIAGRRLGPLVVSVALAAGCFVVAMKSIAEYGAYRSTDPSWRVFGGWMNPNATAAILMLGLFIALGLCLRQAKTGALLAGVAAAMMGFAIVLTGSKGAVSLGLPIGLLGFGLMQVRSAKAILPFLIVFLVLSGVIGLLFIKNIGYVGLGIGSLFLMAAFVASGDGKTSVTRFGAVLAASASLILMLSLTTPTKKAPDASSPSSNAQSVVAVATPISRVGSGEKTQEQSSEFRFNLWKSAGYLIKTKPITGYGFGSFREESGRGGLITSTVLAHNVYLQLWSETGVIPIVLFLVGTGLWIRSVLNGRETLPKDNLYLLSGIAGSIAAILSHSLVDSDLYYFGIGACFFLLMGLGLCLSTDAVAPELIQVPFRIFTGIAVVGLTVFIFTLAAADDAKAVARGDLQARNGEGFRADLDSLGWVGAFDGEAMYLEAIGQSGPGQIELLRQAYALAPTEKIARALATGESGAGKSDEAKSTLKQALERDPSNFHTLSLVMNIAQQEGNTGEAVDYAKRLVAVEKTPYFLVRSIPESIPTETYDARIKVLAPAEKDRKVQADLLAEAVKGYLDYANMKITVLKPQAAQKKDSSFRVPGFDSIEEANQKLEIAVEAASQAAKIYRALGDGKDAAVMDADRVTLATDLAA